MEIKTSKYVFNVELSHQRIEDFILDYEYENKAESLDLFRLLFI